MKLISATLDIRLKTSLARCVEKRGVWDRCVSSTISSKNPSQKQKKTGKLYPAESNVFELANARKMYELNSNKADIYYAYHTIYSFIKEPFTTHHPESVFNTGYTHMYIHLRAYIYAYVYLYMYLYVPVYE